ncbi:MAG: protein kinase [Terriglobia bacterium]|jgi:serine/threonine-protein kinase
MSFQVGDKVGDYQIIGVLGAGGMGRVYKVKNLISDRIDAMKVLLPDLANESDLADRFLREIKVLASLNHPNIAGLHTAFRLENQLLMIMEFVNGTTLEDKLKNGPFPLNDAIDYVSQVLSALGFAHSHGVIHRDIKPANMMLTPENVIKLMDFGIAKSNTDRKLTTAGTTLGSLYYMPPEQVQGTDLDPRSDLYSVGVSLYEMVTGSRPFKGNSDYDLMVAHLQKVPLPPIDIQPELPKALNDIIMVSLEKDPARRFQSAEAFRFALQSVKGGLTSLPIASAQAVMPGLAGQPATPSAALSATEVLGAHPGQPAGAQLQPTTPSQAAMPPSQPQVVPPPATSRSYRGLYMTLGALVAIVVIVLGATQLPRLFRAKAGGAEQAAPLAASTATNSSSAVTQPANASANQQQPPPPLSEPAPTSQTTAAQGGTAVGQPSEPSGPLQGSSNPMTQPLPAGGSKKRLARAGGQAGQAPEEAAAPPSKAGRAAQAAAENAAAAKELEELEDRMTPLAGRANAVKDSVEHLRQQQERAGFSLRQDISASLSNMEQYMDKADAALKSRNPEAAKKSIDLAEREIEKLEKFLGR